MPLYNYKCPDCAELTERRASPEDMTLDCDRCGGTTKRVWTTQYYVIGDIDYVTDNVTGEPKRYTSRKELNADLKQHGLYQKVGKGWW